MRPRIKTAKIEFVIKSDDVKRHIQTYDGTYGIIIHSDKERPGYELKPYRI